MQLLSVACVSVAAKLEETHVPLLLDLQSLEGGSRFLFEPRTVRRMELLLMSALQWRVQGITPFDFLPFFSNTSTSAFDLFPRASALIVSTQRGKSSLYYCIFLINYISRLINLLSLWLNLISCSISLYF